MSEYPTAEEELKTMTKRFWAQVEVTEKVIKERDQYREALLAMREYYKECLITGTLHKQVEAALSLENSEVSPQ
jgi:nitrogenase molybdenum-iron protein alpha/beta subunit